VNVPELMEDGIRAYTRGDLPAAERCWSQVLAIEPGNARARAYMVVLSGRMPPQPVPGEGEPGPGPGAPAPAAGAAARAAPPAAAPEVTSPWDQGPALSPAVVLGEGDGLDLATVSPKSGLRPLVPDATPPAPPQRAVSDVEVWMQGARELFALGDFSGSLEMIEKILKVDSSHAEAREYLRQNEATLIAMYESKLGPSTAVPRLAIKPEEVMWLNLDHRAGFLLAQIDGVVSYDDLFALSGVPRLDTARILASLLQEGVITSKG
jgi:hypothetical protein